eukprot:s1672_g1.t1
MYSALKTQGTASSSSSQKDAGSAERSTIAFTKQGHKLQQVEEALDCIKRAGMDYRAKVVISDGAALQIKIKWGGELTLKGRSGSQESGKCFRERTFAGEESSLQDIAQLHTSLQHDIKIFSSREQRCLQTAAAFAKGLLSLNGALPSIVTELVNTLEDSEWGGPSGVKEGRMSEWQNKPWEEVEELFGFRADDSLRQHATPKEAAMRFAEGVQGDLMDEPSFDMFVTVPHAFDHLVYDAAFEFSDHLCQVVAAVETMMTADNVPGSTTGFKVFFLNRLQRYLRRAAGLPESPREIVETDAALRSLGQATAPLLRSCRGRGGAGQITAFLWPQLLAAGGAYPSLREFLLKDGPSAGVAVLLALASLVLNRPVRSDTAVTGEVTLRGHVLPVGGIRDKVLAAIRGGVKHVLLPVANKRHVKE